MRKGWLGKQRAGIDVLSELHQRWYRYSRQLQRSNKTGESWLHSVPMFAAREVSKLLQLGTIVLVYDKVSFVSAKSWIENPKLKEAALANSGQH